MIPFFKEVFHTFLSSNTFQKGASLTYYAVFSLLPIVIIITSLLGLFFGEQAVATKETTNKKGVHLDAFFNVCTQVIYAFIEIKNSSLLSDFLMRSLINSMASTGFMSARYLRKIHMR